MSDDINADRVQAAKKREQRDVFRIEMRHGHVALVDEEDFLALGSLQWHVFRGGHGGGLYARRSFTVAGKKTSVIMHRVIAGASAGQVVDHINGDTLDNRRANLRLTTLTGNARNMVHNKNKRRGSYKGVDRIPSGRWRASIGAGSRDASSRRRRKLYLGVYETAEDAARAYDRAALAHFGEFASLNFGDAIESEAAK